MRILSWLAKIEIHITSIERIEAKKKRFNQEIIGMLLKILRS